MNDSSYSYDYQPQPQDKGCCTLDQRRKSCVDISKNDGHCGDIAKCCVGIHHAGDQRRCLNAVRNCRGLGNNWDPIASLKPLDMEFIYNETPGYSTTGKLVLEGFGGGLNLQCIVKHAMYGLLFAFAIQYVSKNKMNTNQLVALTVVSAVVQCFLIKL